jgi:hypothetical protein
MNSAHTVRIVLTWIKEVEKIALHIDICKFSDNISFSLLIFIVAYLKNLNNGLWF